MTRRRRGGEFRRRWLSGLPKPERPPAPPTHRGASLARRRRWLSRSWRSRARVRRARPSHACRTGTRCCEGLAAPAGCRWSNRRNHVPHMHAHTAVPLCRRRRTRSASSETVARVEAVNRLEAASHQQESAAEPVDGQRRVPAGMRIRPDGPAGRRAARGEKMRAARYVRRRWPAASGSPCYSPASPHQDLDAWSDGDVGPGARPLPRRCSTMWLIGELGRGTEATALAAPIGRDGRLDIRADRQRPGTSVARRSRAELSSTRRRRRRPPP